MIAAKAIKARMQLKISGIQIALATDFLKPDLLFDGAPAARGEPSFVTATILPGVLVVPLLLGSLDFGGGAW